tara:strand:- start:5092 stop:5487 length:396 start_codon:yes stop_codon:yes gene_type:complete
MASYGPGRGETHRRASGNGSAEARYSKGEKPKPDKPDFTSSLAKLFSGDWNPPSTDSSVRQEDPDRGPDKTAASVKEPTVLAAVPAAITAEPLTEAERRKRALARSPTSRTSGRGIGSISDTTTTNYLLGA